MIMTGPNVLTIGRIILTPIIIRCLVYEQWMAATMLFAVAAITDVCDGTWARWSGQETTLGAYLDPLADKILIVGCYATLVYTYGTTVGIPIWLTGMVIARETLFIAGAAVLGIVSLRRHVSKEKLFIRPTLLGKWTTVCHCVILSMIYAAKAGLWHISPGFIKVMAILTGALMSISGVHYSITWWRMIKVRSAVMIIVFLCLTTGVGAQAPDHDEFTVQRPASTLQSRQRLRETLAELLSEYLELLVEELSLTAQRLAVSNDDRGSQETKLCRSRLQHLSRACTFLREGTSSAATVKQQLVVNDASLYPQLVAEIAYTQGELIKVLRCLLERDASSCFVSCKAKSQLEKYIQQARQLVDSARAHNKKLYAVVHAAEKN